MAVVNPAALALIGLARWYVGPRPADIAHEGAGSADRTRQVPAIGETRLTASVCVVRDARSQGPWSVGRGTWGLFTVWGIVRNGIEAAGGARVIRLGRQALPHPLRDLLHHFTQGLWPSTVPRSRKSRSHDRPKRQPQSKDADAKLLT